MALTLFFITWAVLLETGESTPFIPAGMVASVFLIAAFVFREVLIRRARIKRLEAQRKLDLNLDGVVPAGQKVKPKLSLEENERMLGRIYEKSDAARVLRQVPEAHWKVFELCDQYLLETRKEIARTHVNSPRFRPINKGRGQVKKLHKYHLLKWAKERAGVLSMDSQSSGASYVEKLNQADSAMSCLETALEYYPRDKNLLESHDAVREYVSTIRISERISQAENAASAGDSGKAGIIYKDILMDLSSENLRTREKEIIGENIRNELKKLEKL